MPPVQSSPRTTFLLLFVMAALVGGGVLAGHLHHQPGSPVVQTSGAHVSIRGSVVASNGAPNCASAPNAVQSGAPVTILDATGAVLGTTSLGAGQPGAPGSCHWDYVVSVPTTDRYQVQVGGIPPLTVSRATLQRGLFTEQDPTPNAGVSGIESGI